MDMGPQPRAAGPPTGALQAWERWGHAPPPFLKNMSEGRAVQIQGVQSYENLKQTLKNYQ